MSGGGDIGGGCSKPLTDDIGYLKWLVEGAERDLEAAKQRLYKAQERGKKAQEDERGRLQQDANVDQRDTSEQGGKSLPLDPS